MSQAGLRLEGRTVLLTGATGGIGAAIARALHARGARLVLTGRRVEVLESLRDDLDGAPELIGTDLNDRDAVAALGRRAAEVDVVVANAALPGSGPVVEYSPEQIDRALEVNLRAPMQLTRAAVPAMVDRGAGHLVFISSLSGKVASAGSAIYSATKFGLRAFASGLRQDLDDTPVGVTTVFPGFVSGAGMFAEAGVDLPRGVGTKTPEEVADAVVRGIERDRMEIDVAPFGLRAATRFGAVAPVLATRLQKRLGSRALSDAIGEGQASKR